MLGVGARVEEEAEDEKREVERPPVESQSPLLLKTLVLGSLRVGPSGVVFVVVVAGGDGPQRSDGASPGRRALR